jgi:hypothetical protein
VCCVHLLGLSILWSVIKSRSIWMKFLRTTRIRNIIIEDILRCDVIVSFFTSYYTPFFWYSIEYLLSFNTWLLLIILNHRAQIYINWQTEFFCFADRASRYNSGKWPTWRTTLFSYMFISILYMFRATSCTSSGEPTVSLQRLVYVTLCRWPYSMQVGKELPDLHTKRPPTQSDIYQKV